MNTTFAEAAAKKTSRTKLACRIALDIVLILVLITLYSKNVISLMYHEVVGLVLFALFGLHLILNRKWIANLFMSKLSKGAKPKIMAVVNALLILSWAAVMVTGILVSKKLFTFQISSLNPIHFFSAALALILTGVHFGLHWQYFWGFLGKRIHIPRVIAISLMVIVILFGCWQTFNSSFARWLSAPFTASSGEHSRGGYQHEEEMSENDVGRNEAENGSIISDDSETAASSGKNNDMSGNSSRAGHGAQPFSVLNLLKVIATYFSMTFLFAAITRGIELLIKKIRSC